MKLMATSAAAAAANAVLVLCVFQKHMDIGAAYCDVFITATLLP